MNLKDIKKMDKEFKGDDLNLPGKSSLNMGVYDRYMNLSKQVSTWRRLTIIFAIMMSISITMFIYKSFEKQYIPYVIRFYQDGDVKSEILTANSGQNVSLSEKEIQYFLTNVIYKLRNVPSDQKFYISRLEEIYPYLSRNAKNKFQVFINEDTNTNAVLKEKYTINSSIKSFIKISDNKYQINWRESTYDTSGENTFNVEYTTILDVGYYAVTTDQQIRENPIGLVIKDIEIKEVSN